MAQETKTTIHPILRFCIVIACAWFFCGGIIGAVLMMTDAIPDECQDGLKVVECK